MWYEWITQNRPDADLIPSNIKSWVNIFGVIGNYSWAWIWMQKGYTIYGNIGLSFHTYPGWSGIVLYGWNLYSIYSRADVGNNYPNITIIKLNVSGNSVSVFQTSMSLVFPWWFSPNPLAKLLDWNKIYFVWTANWHYSTTYFDLISQTFTNLGDVNHTTWTTYNDTETIWWVIYTPYETGSWLNAPYMIWVALS